MNHVPHHRKPTVSLSIVSHGQGQLVDTLLRDIGSWVGAPLQIVLTFNVPEDRSFLSAHSRLPIKVIVNAEPKGFGANHNAAFSAEPGDIFVVLNPDIRATDLDFEPLIETLGVPTVGACAPLVLSPQGRPEDSARRFPTFLRLAKRVVFKERTSDYVFENRPVSVDWVAGMFIAFRSEVYREIDGFDERYFMYLEDADLCRRLRQRSFDVVVDPRCQVIHDARRASRRDLKHMRWHYRSACRFLFGI